MNVQSFMRLANLSSSAEINLMRAHRGGGVARPAPASVLSEAEFLGSWLNKILQRRHRLSPAQQQLAHTVARFTDDDHRRQCEVAACEHPAVYEQIGVQVWCARCRAVALAETIESADVRIGEAVHVAD